MHRAWPSAISVSQRTRCGRENFTVEARSAEHFRDDLSLFDETSTLRCRQMSWLRSRGSISNPAGAVRSLCRTLYTTQYYYMWVLEVGRAIVY
jgi:hypothetical protein